jgi:hypothetical protein
MISMSSSVLFSITCNKKKRNLLTKPVRFWRLTLMMMMLVIAISELFVIFHYDLVNFHKTTFSTFVQMYEL